MTDKIQAYIDSEQLFDKPSNILVAVSGGIDSVCLATVLHQLGYNMALAHCNFKLRGDASDADEDFVKALASQLNVPVFVKHFDTAEHAEQHKISIQMAARNLRYNWFESIRHQHHFQHIAIAHNADDSIETFFINLIRGTGIKGLTGIKARHGNLVRPLLSIHRDEIETFAHNYNITFRTDASNLSTKYLRNAIRHEVLPIFESMNAGFRATMVENIAHLADAETVYNAYLTMAVGELLQPSPDGTFAIHIGALLSKPASQTLLHEIMQPFGFAPKSIKEIYESVHSTSGKFFYSPQYRVIKDREHLIVTPNTEPSNQRYYIDESRVPENCPLKLEIGFIDADGYNMSKSSLQACFDADKVQFPLMLRKWQQGDYFQPLGMAGMKKISDFFIDNKLSVYQKETTWLLTMADEIIWVMGLRIDNRFKITTSTRTVLEIRMVE